jgi:hypothetical protein
MVPWRACACLCLDNGLAAGFSGLETHRASDTDMEGPGWIRPATQHENARRKCERGWINTKGQGQGDLCGYQEKVHRKSA